MILPVDRLALGIDFSTLAIHVAYGQDEAPFRVVLPLDNLDPEDRAVQVAEYLNEFLARVEGHNPGLRLSVMCIERPWLGHSAKTLITLTQVQTACLITCQLRNWYAIQEDPNVIRKKILGVGTVPEKGGIKKLAQQYVRDHHQLEVDPDTADSIVIWEYAKWLAEHAELSE